jgi:hypothetical protein
MKLRYMAAVAVAALLLALLLSPAAAQELQIWQDEEGVLHLEGSGGGEKPAHLKQGSRAKEPAGQAPTPKPRKRESRAEVWSRAEVAIYVADW